MTVSTTIHRRIEWWDTDASGHFHNATIMRMCEACEGEMIRRLGIRDYFGQTPRVRQEIDFEAKLYYGQEVTTTMTVERLGRSSLILGFEVWGEEHEGVPRRLAATGRVVVVYVPRDTEKSEPWPDSMVEAFEAAGAVRELSRPGTR